MASLRVAVLASLLLIASALAASAAGQKVIVRVPTHATIDASLTVPVGGEGPPLLRVFVSTWPDLRQERRNRALFQRWTGFRKQYSGPKYPF